METSSFNIAESTPIITKAATWIPTILATANVANSAPGNTDGLSRAGSVIRSDASGLEKAVNLGFSATEYVSNASLSINQNPQLFETKVLQLGSAISSSANMIDSAMPIVGTVSKIIRGIAGILRHIPFLGRFFNRIYEESSKVADFHDNYAGQIREINNMIQAGTRKEVLIKAAGGVIGTINKIAEVDHAIAPSRNVLLTSAGTISSAVGSIRDPIKKVLDEIPTLKQQWQDFLSKNSFGDINKLWEEFSRKYIKKTTTT